MTFQFKIQIKNITKPPVWRRVVVPADITFYDFHIVIQVAFGWENAHLFLFSPQGWQSFPMIQLEAEDNVDFFAPDETPLDATTTKLSDIFTVEKQKFTYIYDFGDDWAHAITLEKIVETEALFPVCLVGKGTCPPEDCGGPWGYEELKETLNNPEDEEYGELKEWLGLEADEDWDAKRVDIKDANKRLLHIFKKEKM